MLRAPSLALVAAALTLACTGDGETRVSLAGGPCSATSGCLPGHACQAGVCQALCHDDGQCPASRWCSAGACVPRSASGWTYGAFGEWSACSVECGAGVETRARDCRDIEGTPGDCERCGGACVEERACANGSGCSYSAWTPIGSCGASCDAPEQPYERSCLDPQSVAVECALCGGACDKMDACACASCGDSVVQSGVGELCDTGASRTDAACSGCCRTNCQPQRCGDGVVDSVASETCDLGVLNSNEACSGCCRTNCTVQRCGDGVVDVARSESCDQATLNRNTSCSDCCRTNCLPQRCGDQIVDTIDGEACDRGTSLNSDAPCSTSGCCRTTCVTPRCGDGVVDPYLSETCDTGAQLSDMPCNGCCRSTCTPQRCGDFVVDTARGEECDDGPGGDLDGCASCTLAEKPITGRYASIAVGAAGIIAMAWFDPNDTHVRGRWIAASPATTAAISFSTYAYTSDPRPQISMAASGKALIVWPSPSDSQGVKYFRLALNNASAPSPPSTLSTASSGASSVSAAMHANESFVIAWESGYQPNRDVWANPFDLNGSSLSPDHATLDETGDEAEVEVAMDNIGRVIAVWRASDSSGDGIFAQCFDGTSSSVANRPTNPSDVAINQTESGDQRRPAVAIQRGSSSASKAVVVWRNDPGANVLLRRVNVDDDSCEAVGADQLVTASGSGSNNPRVAMDQSGAFVVVWSEGSRIMAQRYDQDAVAQWTSPVQVNVLTAYGASDPQVAIDPAGTRIAVAWWSTSGYVFMQRLGSDGRRQHDAPW